MSNEWNNYKKIYEKIVSLSSLCNIRRRNSVRVGFLDLGL